MKIIIAGAGEVGTHLAKLLAKENFNTILIDEDPEKLEDLDANYDLLTKVGSPTSIETLRDSGMDTADLFIAVTPSESVNMTACMLAHNLEAKKTLARVTNDEYLEEKNKDFFSRLGVDYLICPEKLASEEIIQALKHTWLRQYLEFCEGRLVMLGIKVRENSVLVNKSFNTGFIDESKFRVVAISRKLKTIIPKGDDRILPEDFVYFITQKEYVSFVREQAGKELIKVQNIMVMGGSRIAQKTISNLPQDVDVKLFERDREKCYNLSEKLQNTLLINSDGRDVETLLSEGIGSIDAFVATTANSEANILACLEAKRRGVKKTIVEVENLDYIRLAKELDVGKVINKKLITVSYIYQLTLDADVLEVKSLVSADAQVVEFVVKEGAKIAKKSLKDIKLPNDVNVGGFIRDGVGYLAYGNTQLLPGDHVVLFCLSSAIRKIESYFN